MNANVLAGVARIIGRRFGIEVTIGGREAWCDMKANPPVINVPYLADDDPERVARLRGFIDHETAHVRHTDATVFVNVMQMDRYLGRILNMFEDVYVEREISKSYPGCRENLRRLQDSVFVVKGAALENERNRLAGIDGSDSRELFGLADAYVLRALRSQSNDGVEPVMRMTRERLEELVPGLADRLDGVIGRAPAEGVSTEANCDLAREVVDILRSELTRQQDEPEQEPGGGQQSGQGDGQSGEDRQSGQDDGQQSGQDDCQQSGQDGQGLDQGDERQSGGQSGGGQQSRKSMSTYDFEMAAWDRSGQDEIRDALRKDATDSQHDAGILSDGGSVSMRDSLKRPKMLSGADRAKAGQASAALASRLRSLLQARRLRYGQVATSGQLDDRRLSRVASGDYDVFRRKTPVVEENTDVIFLMDYSGSMGNGNREVVARQSLHAVLTALRGVPGVRTAAYGFDDDELITVLRPGQMYRGECDVTAGGGTYPGEAIMRVVTKFTDPDRRRIIIVFTDGDAQSMRTFRDVVDSVTSSGYAELYGIGIQSDAVARVFKEGRCAVVRQLSDLPKALFGVLQRGMTR